MLTFTNLLFVICSCLWRTWSSFISWSVLKLCHLGVKKVSLLLRFVVPLLWVYLKGNCKISSITNGRTRCELRVRQIPCFMEVDTVLINNWATHQVAYLAVSRSETKQWTLLKSLHGLFVSAAVKSHCIKRKMYEIEVTAEKAKS